MTEALARKANRFVAQGLTGYDACYAALAWDLKGQWLTFDARAHRMIQNRNLSYLLTEGMPPNWP